MTQTSHKKIIFVTPPYHSGIPEIAGRWLPLGLVYLAGAARLAGLEAEIYDAMAKGDGYPEIERELRERCGDYVAVGAMTATVNDAVKTLELAKRIGPETVTILGGVHPTFMAREILQSSAAVDYVVLGEGEEALRRLLLVLEEGGDPAALPGVAFRREGEVVVTAPGPLASDLDALPAAWDLLEWELYSYFIIPGSRFAAVSTSRGCRHDCAYCSQQQFWCNSWRGRDPLLAAAEIVTLHEKYGANVFLITDEHPTCDRKRWELFLDALIESGVSVQLIMESRAEDIVRDRDIFWKYRRAGVLHVSLGVETRDCRTFAASSGNVEIVREAIGILQEHDVVSEASFLLGFPDETPESVRETLGLAQKLNPDSANFFAFTPWPYAELPQGTEELVIDPDYARYNFIDAVLKPVQMTLREMDAALAECYRKFYMGKMLDLISMPGSTRRSYLLKATKLIMSSPFVIKKLNPWAARPQNGSNT
jgi:anaerobic magnesium-protoporphyrin IX monomethyl ester cyclase